MARNKSDSNSPKTKTKNKERNHPRHESVNEQDDELFDESDEEPWDEQRNEPFSLCQYLLAGLFVYFIFVRPSNKYDYDVFLSFRGDDVRDGLTGHLVTALTDNRIKTFVDYKLRSGDKLLGIIQAIQKSRVAVIIFSQDFASSTWCLEEVVAIIECHALRKMLVPVFFRVNPSDVAYQNGTFAQAFASHEEGYKCKPYKVLRWRNALREAANKAGWDFGVIRSEAQLVKYIVEDIGKKIKQRSSCCEPEHKMLIGTYHLIEKTLNALALAMARTREVFAEY